MGVAAVTAASLAGAPAGAAAPAQAQTADMFCLVQPGEKTRCTSTEAEMREMAPAASHVLNLWEHPEYQGFHLEVWKPQGDCSPESDFSPPDSSGDIPLLNGQRWVSSVHKIDTGHCKLGAGRPERRALDGGRERLATARQSRQRLDNRAARVLVD